MIQALEIAGTFYGVLFLAGFLAALPGWFRRRSAPKARVVELAEYRSNVRRIDSVRQVRP